MKLPKKINWKKKAWKVFSEYIRRENDGICVFHLKCADKNIPPPCRCAGVPQACHKISRTKTAILFDRRNTFCGCAGSNAWANFNRLEWDKLWRTLWSEDVKYLEVMKNKKNGLGSWTYKFIYDEYQKKLKEI
jgi:hypothetical protein